MAKGVLKTSSENISNLNKSLVYQSIQGFFSLIDPSPPQICHVLLLIFSLKNEVADNTWAEPRFRYKLKGAEKLPLTYISLQNLAKLYLL